MALILLGTSILLILKDSPYIPQTISEILFYEPDRDDYIKASILLTILFSFEAWIMFKGAFYIEIPPKLRRSLIREENSSKLKPTETVWSKVTAILRMIKQLP